MTKRQFLVTIEGEHMDPEDLQGVVNLALIDGGATVEALPENVGGFPAHWDANAPRGTVMVFQADQREPIGHITPEPAEHFTGEDHGPTPEQWDMLRDRVKSMILGRPYGHVEVVQSDGTSRPVQPGEILRIEDAQNED